MVGVVEVVQLGVEGTHLCKQYQRVKRKPTSLRRRPVQPLLHRMWRIVAELVLVVVDLAVEVDIMATHEGGNALVVWEAARSTSPIYQQTLLRTRRKPIHQL